MNYSFIKWILTVNLLFEVKLYYHKNGQPHKKGTVFGIILGSPSNTDITIETDHTLNEYSTGGISDKTNKLFDND